MFLKLAFEMLFGIPYLETYFEATDSIVFTLSNF